MTTTPVQLNDNQLESICGGNQGRYMTELKEFICPSLKGDSFIFSYPGSTRKIQTGAEDKFFALIIKKAEEHGSITFYSTSGKSKTYTAAQLNDMFKD